MVGSAWRLLIHLFLQTLTLSAPCVQGATWDYYRQPRSKEHQVRGSDTKFEIGFIECVSQSSSSSLTPRSAARLVEKQQGGRNLKAVHRLLKNRVSLRSAERRNCHCTTDKEARWSSWKSRH